MSSPKKKFQKKKDREKRKHKEKIERDLESIYPLVLIDPKNGDPDLVGLVRDAVSKIRFSDPSVFGPEEREFYKKGCEQGFGVFVRMAKDGFSGVKGVSEETKNRTVLTWACGYGERLLRRIPEDSKKKYLPFNDVAIQFVGRRIVVGFDSLLTEKSPGGSIYFSRKRPQIKFGENEYTVGFSRHAIERICERQNPRYMTYAGLGDAFVFFGGCRYYKPVYLEGGQAAFVLLNRCDNPGFIQANYLDRVLGKENLQKGQGNCYYVVGYCPVVFDKGFAKAKTFLIPGYSGTPEYSLLLKSKFPQSERERLLKMTHDATEDDVFMGENLELIKWFHNNGVPQVMQMSHKVFD